MIERRVSVRVNSAVKKRQRDNARPAPLLYQIDKQRQQHDQVIDIASRINLPILGQSKFLSDFIKILLSNFIQIVMRWKKRELSEVNWHLCLAVMVVFRLYKMEKQNINGYLQYFPPSDIIKRTPKRPHPKILPHILEEYQYRITNHLLIKKIISPKRDKLIVNSLQNIKRSNYSSKSKLKIQTKASLVENMRRETEYKKHSEYRVKTAGLKHKAGSSLCLTDFNDSQHEARTRVMESSFKRQPQAYRQQKKQIKTPLHRSLYQPINRHGAAQLYGFGPTILSIDHIQLATNPLLRPNTLIQLELVEKCAITSRMNGGQDQEKVVRTQPIAYASLPRQDKSCSKVKFAMKVSRIGDFVPLRVWKYIGVQCVDLGTVDIPLSLYRMGISQQSTPDQYNQLTWQYKQGTSDCIRLVLNGAVSCQLRGNNCHQMQTKVLLKYKVYSKRFTQLQSTQYIASQL